MRVICSGPQQDQDTEGVGCRVGREGGESRDRNDKTSEWGGGEVEERKVDFAAQCQDPKNNSPVFLLLLQVGNLLSFSENG